MIYLQLLISYLKIGFLGFGGGYAMLSFIQYEVVIKHGWISGAELADIVAISQMTPGPIAINSATYIGYNVGGFLGALIATISVCTPAMTLMVFVTKSFLYLKDNPYMSGIMKAMHPVIVAMIGAAGISLIFPTNPAAGGENFIDIWSWILFGLAFIAAASKRVSLIVVIIASAIAGIAIYYIPTIL